VTSRASGTPGSTSSNGAARSLGGASWPAVVKAVALRPHLWSEAARVGVRLVPRDWWRFRSGLTLPLPSRDYLEFRAETQYGDPSAAPTAQDVVTYLQWCRRQRSLR